MTLGERIVHYRKRQGLSQEQLSQRLGVSRQSVSKWERDESLPEAFGLGLLARFLMGPMFPPLELLLQAGGPVRAAALGFQIITVAVLVVGGLAVVGGLIAAAVLYRRRPGGKK